MSDFSLGSISPLNVQGWNTFDYPERAQVVPLIGDGTSTGLNAVVQQSALTMRESTIHGVLTSSSDVDTLQGYFEDKSSAVTFTDSSSNTFSVVVFDLETDLIYPGLWTYSCRLVQVA